MNIIRNRKTAELQNWVFLSLNLNLNLFGEPQHRGTNSLEYLMPLASNLQPQAYGFTL